MNAKPELRDDERDRACAYVEAHHGSDPLAELCWAVLSSLSIEEDLWKAADRLSEDESDGVGDLLGQIRLDSMYELRDILFRRILDKLS